MMIGPAPTMSIDLMSVRLGILFPACAQAAEAGDPVGPLFKLTQIVARQSERVADDDERQRYGEVIDELASTIADKPVDQLVGDCADAGPERGNPLLGEGTVHQIPVFSVIGRVGGQERGHGHLTGRTMAPIERALVSKMGFRFCTPAMIVSMIGNMPCVTPKAIFDGGPIPK